MRNLFVARFVIVSIICLTLVFAPTLPVVAQATTRAEQLEALATTLVSIGDLIRTSPTLTERQRLDLYSQLVGVSNAIVALRQPATAPVTTDTVERQDISRVILSYDYERPAEISAEVRFATSSPQTFTWRHPQLLENTTFGSRMSAVRQFGSYEIGTEYGITQSDARRLVYLSARNPLRDLPVAINSGDANKIMLDFGTYSVINDITILPGFGTGSIQLRSDQDELLEMEIYKNQIENEYNQRTQDGDKYHYRQVFSLSRVDDIPRHRGPEDPDLKIVTEIVERNIDKERVIEILVDLFGNHPLTEEIDDYEEKLLKFMLENGAYVTVGDNARPTPRDKTCYDDADVLVVNELVGSLISGMKIQHAPVEELLNITAPIQVQEYTTTIRCYGVKKFF